MNIEHLQDQQRFVLMKDGKECHLDYQMLSATDIDFTHTYVPFGLRGHGLAQILVEHGLAWAKGQSFKIQASCWYVRDFL